jgi:hypothetical protein
MELQINDKITISQLQQQFGLEFPFLKLEFFDLPPTLNGLPKSRMLQNHKLLGTCRKKHNEGIIKISPDDTVKKLERTFWLEFGLTAEVFRKSGNLWIETTLSDSWTLKQQNEEGKALSNNRKFKDAKQEDRLGKDK